MRSKLLLAFCITFILALVVGYTLANLTFQYKITNFAKIKTIGVNVFSDQNCTQQVTFIDWGILEPNTSKTITVYVKSSSNVPITLLIYPENWNPSNCSDYMTLTPNPNNIVIEPSEVIEINLTLSIASDIQGIIAFSFDIMFNGSS